MNAEDAVLAATQAQINVWMDGFTENARYEIVDYEEEATEAKYELLAETQTAMNYAQAAADADARGASQRTYFAGSWERTTAASRTAVPSKCQGGSREKSAGALSSQRSRQR